MAITQAMCTSFKKELLEGTHNFKNSGGSTFKLALFTSSATLGASTTAYATTNEVSGTGYSAGGNTLTRVDPTTSGTTAFTDFADTTFSTATITANGALIYNSSASDARLLCWRLVAIRHQLLVILLFSSQQRTRVTLLSVSPKR